MLALLATTQLIGVIDFSIVNVALPSIGHQFTLRTDQVQWVVSAYVLMEAGFVLLGGRLCDVFDTKSVFIGALALFGIASLAGGLAPTATLVFIARGVQGLASAVLAPGSLVLVTREFEAGAARNRALGVFGAVAMLGFLLGVILGGTLTGYLGWRSVFFVNVPIVAVMLVGAAILLRPKSGGEVSSRLDLPGAAVGTAAMLALIVAITTTSGDIARFAAFIALAVALLAIFIWIERLAPNPLVPFAVLRSRQFTGAIVSFGLVNLAGGILLFTTTFVLQRTLGLSPQGAGLAFVPGAMSGIAGALLVGVVIQRLGLRRTVMVALALLAASLAPLLGPGLHGSAAWVAFGFAIGSMGFVGSSVATTIAATSSVTHERMGLAGGLLNTFQFLGTAVGAAVAGALGAPGTVTAYATAILTALFVFLLAGALSFVAYAPNTSNTEKRNQQHGLRAPGGS